MENVAKTKAENGVREKETRSVFVMQQFLSSLTCVPGGNTVGRYQLQGFWEAGPVDPGHGQAPLEVRGDCVRLPILFLLVS